MFIIFRINHNEAIELEYQVRKLFNCYKTGVSGLANADHFESRPIDAAIMVVSYIHANGLQLSETEYDEFLSKYDIIFSYPEENDAKNKVSNYITELSDIVNKYI